LAFTDYTSSPAGSSAGGAATHAQPTAEYKDHGKLKKEYLDYLHSKRDEIDEAKDARRYRHGSHYTNEQVETLRRRKQPVVTYNRISRKIDGVVGLVEKLRQAPKAYPRTPKHEEGAELATAVLRYVLDEQEWKAKSPICAADGATEGIGGIELLLEQGDKGDVEVAFDIVDPDGFFYDARSTRLDFSDATYMGVGKWVDTDLAKQMFPDKADELDSIQDGSDLTSNSDKDQKWFSSDLSRVRIVDHWYKHKGEWCYCIYTGAMKLQEGKSPYVDEKGKTFCKFVMFSANVDHDGDRYGFVRQLKSAQDEINSRRSKGLHELNTRRIIAERGAFDDVEATRREAARPDGVVIRNPGKEALFDDSAKAANLQGQLEFLQEAKNEIENFGPNPSLVDGKLEAKSGRAIALMQQAGMAELGPFILSYRGWKLRVYRGIFNAIQKHWTGERWVRVTDNDDVAQFIQINGVGIDPNTGQPAIINGIGSLDVDIILDEGPDTITLAQETHETLANVLSTVGPMLTPPEARAVVSIFLDTSQIPSEQKKQFKDAAAQASQPNPMQELEVAEAAAKVKDTEAAAQLKMAQAAKTMAEAQAPEQMDTSAMEAQASIERENARLAMEGEKHAVTIEHQRKANEMDLQQKAMELARAAKAMESESRMSSIKEQTAKSQNDLVGAQVAKTKAEASRPKEQPKEKKSDDGGKNDAVMGTAMTAVAAALDRMTKPKRIVRGTDGRAASVETVD
jgi:hypothetical protein